MTNFKSKSLQNYKNLYKLSKFVYGYIASRVKENEIGTLKQIFEEMDKNKDGTLGINEVKEALNKMQSMKDTDEQEKEDIIKSLDTDKSQKIEYNEFLTACLEQKTYLREEYLIDAFNMLDYDGSGKISKEEIKKAINGDISDEALNKLIKDFDLDGDGEIDYKEFLIGMSNINKKEEEVKDEKTAPPKKNK